MIWLTIRELKVKNSYSYDPLNRLLQGTMASNKGRETMTYDRHGNILTLARTGTTSALVDNLTYTYAGNRLSSVADAVATVDANYQLPGTTSYTYDVNGNMKTRLNSASTANNITAVTYNWLQLPQAVTAPGGNVSYTYDATGRKLRSTNGIAGQTRDYADGIEYAGGTMEMVQHEEGRILRSGTTYTYDYFLRDHLGNNRVGFAQGTNVTIPNFSTDYYPFGLAYRENMRVSTPKNNYLYNGKELQDGLKLYDYGARFYDPVIGRFYTVDPLSEKYTSWTSYNYGFNNPIRFIDPDGREGTDWVKRDGKIRWDEKVTSANDKDLKQNDRYLGKDYSTKTANYYSDGSAFFKNEWEGYNYMLDNSNMQKGNGEIENLGYITKNGVAVLPTSGVDVGGKKFQNTSLSAEIDVKGYTRSGEGSTLKVNFHGKILNPIAWVHTHPDSYGGFGQSSGDNYWTKILGVPSIIFGRSNVYGQSVNDAKKYIGGGTIMTLNDLRQGKISIINNIKLLQ